MKLLIAEDNSRMRNMIKEMFTSYFEKIYECEEGSAAIEEYKTGRPDWVFMDIKMKGMDGITAAGKITGLFPDAKIVMVTDYDDKDFRTAASLNGAIGYILKENLDDIFKILIK
jgi:DNA-binding NarL/FixJ family response regulator